MAAFNEEQTKTLESMFDHMWTRMMSIDDKIEDHGVRLAGLIGALCVNEVLTREQVISLTQMLHMEASERRAPIESNDMTENDITRHILQGGTWEDKI